MNYDPYATPVASSSSLHQAEAGAGSSTQPSRGGSPPAKKPRGSRGGKAKDGSGESKRGKKKSIATVVDGHTTKPARGRGGGGPGSRGGRGRGRGRGGSKPRGTSRDSTAAASSSRRSPSERARTGTATAADTRGTTAGGSPGADDTVAAHEQTGITRRARGGDDDDEEGDEDDDDDEEELLDSLAEEDVQWREEMEKIRGQAMGPLIAAMSAEQYDRHEAYRRSGFHRGNLRRLINAHLAGGGTGASINPTMTMAFGGVAKVFVGEIIEGARRLYPNVSEDMPLPPSAILESYRIYCQKHAESGSLARGLGHPESVNGGSSLGGGMGGRRRLF